MKRTLYICYICLLLITGCKLRNVQHESNNNLDFDKCSINEIETTSSLINDFDSLINESNIFLEIQQNNGSSIKANEYFTRRIIDLFRLRGETIWRDTGIDNYDVILKFAGYKDIHINLDCESFWFEGEDELYRIVGLKEQWLRYIIRFKDDELFYDSFEKTLLGTIITYIDDDEIMDTANLFYDGDIRLRVNETEKIIESLAQDEVFSYSGQLSSIDKLYDLRFIEESQLLGVVHKNFQMRSPNVDFTLYDYKDDIINQIWSVDELNIEIKNILLEEEKVDLAFPLVNKEYTINLTQEELEESKVIINELVDNGIVIDKEFMNDIKYNILCNICDLLLTDYNEDGYEELILLADIYTVGARTPLRINERVIFIFNISTESIECIDIIFKRDVGKENFPFTYFLD